MENKNKNFLLYANSSIDDVLKDLKTSMQGLSHTEAEQRLREYGANEMKETIVTWFQVLKNQIKNPFILVFIFIAVLYLFTQQYTECIILLIIMIINTVIGFYQEYQSSKAMELLQSYLQSTIIVLRDGNDEQIVINKLVIGDIIKLNAGDIIPADCRFVATDNCTVDEAMLTGESLPIQKTHILTDNKITELYNAYTIGFTGTVVVDGSAIAVVFATGTKTEMGSIAILTTHTISKSNLTQNTMKLARIVFGMVIISLIFIMILNLFTKHVSFFNFLLFAGALAITAIPSALPIVITFCLTKGAMALHKHKMIVKRLSAIEDLGSVEILCTDKTGTLTENVLSVQDVYTENEEQTLLYAALTSDMAAHAKKIISNGFDEAIIQALTTEEAKAAHEYTVIEELPFTYERHRSVTLAQKDDIFVLVTKGSAEYVISETVSLSKKQFDEINTWVKEHELKGSRVLAVAVKTIKNAKKLGRRSLGEGWQDITTYDKDYDTIGLIAFADPLKSTATHALEKAQALGVQIKIFSGDSAYVCFTIAKQLGLENTFENVVLGADFEKASEEEKISLVQKHTIFARITPQQKYQMIELLQRNSTVGYLGDGINDAPALKIAHVGIVVHTAAAVAREAAEIIMLQKSLLNVLLGIEEGRKIIINTLKYIKITISSNVGNFYSLAFSSLLINYLPMLPLQLLFLDLTTDLPLIAISTDSVKKTELQKPLHYYLKDISFVTFLFGLVSSPFDFLVFAFFKDHPATLQTSWFIASALTQLALIFSLRTKQPFWRAHHPSLFLFCLCMLAAIIVTMVPFTQFGQKFFLFARPSIHDMIIIFAIVIAYFITTETVKILYYRVKNHID